MKYWSFAAGLCLLVSCNSKNNDKVNPDFVKYESTNFSIEKPKSWKVVYDRDHGGKMDEVGIFDPKDATINSGLILNSLPLETLKSSDSVFVYQLFDNVKKAFVKDGNYTFSSDRKMHVETLQKLKVYKMDFALDVDKVHYLGKVKVFTSGRRSYSALYLMKEDLVKENFPKMDSMIISIKTLK